MEWTRGAVVGRGSFSTVSLAFVRRCDDDRRQLPPLMAVKSCPLPCSAFLQQEMSVLFDLQGCPQVVRCFGEDVAVDAATGAQFYNLFLEYVAGGTLYDLLSRSGGPLGVPAVRRYARSILRGLNYVHSRGYAHCDIKLQNILVGSGGEAIKIADFGLAKKIGEKSREVAGAGIRGTPLYMSPESVARSEYGAPADIWSLGCVVAEMASGRPAWRCSGDGDAWELFFRIGFGDELPEIPSELSEEGKDFLRRCLVKDPAKRWTAEMLLQHPFIALDADLVDASVDVLNQCSSTESSPRSVLGLSQWLSPRSPSNSINSALMESVEIHPDSSVPSPADRVKELATSQWPNWSSCSSADGWIDARASDISSISEETGHQAQDPQLDSMLILGEMVSRDGYRYECRPDRVDELLEFDSLGPSATVQLVLPSLALKHVDRTECASDSTQIIDSEIAGTCISSSLSQIGRLNMSSFCSLRAKDCKVDSTLNVHKYTDV